MNDKTSSVKIDDSDALVFLWEHINDEGRALVLNQQGLRNLPDGWKDEIGSVGTFRCPMDLKDALKIKNLFEWARLSELRHCRDQVYELKATREADKAADWLKNNLPGDASWCRWETLELRVKESRIKGRMEVRIKQKGVGQDTEHFEFDYSVGDTPTVVWEKKFVILGITVGTMRVDVVELLVAAGAL